MMQLRLAAAHSTGASKASEGPVHSVGPTVWAASQAQTQQRGNTSQPKGHDLPCPCQPGRRHSWIGTVGTESCSALARYGLRGQGPTVHPASVTHVLTRHHHVAVQRVHVGEDEALVSVDGVPRPQLLGPRHVRHGVGLEGEGEGVMREREMMGESNAGHSKHLNQKL